MALEAARSWQCEDIYIGCSGNFGLERALSGLSVRLHSNDVSLHAGALGAYLTGQPFTITVRDPGYDWLAPYLGSPLDIVATLLVSTSMLQGYGQDALYWQRIHAAYKKRFPQLQESTKAKIEPILAQIKVADFFAGDVLDYLEQIPPSAGVILVPHTRGLHRLYGPLDKVFEWLEQPPFQVFSKETIPWLRTWLSAHDHWLLFSEIEMEGLGDYLRGSSKSGYRAVPVNCYGDMEHARIAMPHLAAQPPGFPVMDGDYVIDDNSCLQLMRVKAPVFRWLRDAYLKKVVAPADPDYDFVVLVDGRIIGIIGISASLYFGGDWCDAYMMCDVAVGGTRYPHLSKLVLAASLSKELKLLIPNPTISATLKRIGTTAFTDNPVSMKYRGAYKIHSRKPGALNYVGNSGRWTLKEAFLWWKRLHGEMVSPQASTSQTD